MGAEFVVNAFVSTFAEEMEINVAKGRWNKVGLS